MDWKIIIVASLVTLTYAITGETHIPRDAKPFATATLEPTAGNKVSGVVNFIQNGDGLLISLKARNLPIGDHGFHIHEKGDCSAPDASSAGDHYNPLGAKHGGPYSNDRHIGDLGNILVAKSGSIDVVLDVPPMEKNFVWKVIIGKAVVIHEKADDFVSQPAGNAGDRIACGVIRGTAFVAE